MLGNLLTLVAFLALVVLFAWLARRAWKSKRALVKWPGAILAGFLTLLLGLITVVYAKGLWALYAPYPVAAVNLTVSSSPDQLARGEHLAGVLCASCHSQNAELPLSGGSDMSQEISLPVGTLVPPNLTPAGRIKDLTDADIYRILRTGIEPNGRLSLMTAFPVRNLSDTDAQAIIAYLRAAAPVQKETPPISLSPLMVMLLGAGVIGLDVPSTIQPVSATPKAANPEYGQYVMSFMDCKGCHGPTLSADGGPLAPPGASNLTLIVPQWSRDDFFKTMRTGVDPTGHQVQPPMPWKTIGKLDDVELEALYRYLHGLAPVAEK